MEAIEALLRERGQRIAYAALSDGSRVTPGTAYQCLRAIDERGGDAYIGSETEVLLVECAPAPGLLEAASARSVTAIDHHRPGDPGYGRPPAEFLPASSLGQLILRMGIRTWPTCSGEGIDGDDATPRFRRGGPTG